MASLNYVDNVRGHADASTGLYYHWFYEENGKVEERWMSYDSFKEDDEESLKRREAFWEAVLYWYEENNSIKYKIDNMRHDSFFHYIEYIDGKEIESGWGVYTNLHLDKEKKAWLKAVKKYIKDYKVETKLTAIEKYIEDILNRNKVDEDNYTRPKSLVMPSFLKALADLIKSIATGDLGDDLIDKAMECSSPNIPTPFAMLKYAFQAAGFNLKMEYTKLLENVKDLGVSAYIPPVIKAIQKMTKSTFDDVNVTYNEIARVSNKFYRKWRKYLEDSKGASKEEAKKSREEALKEFNKIDPPLKEFVAKMVYLDVVLNVTKTLADLEQAGLETWRNVIAEAKALKHTDFDIDSADVKKLKQQLIMLLPLVGALVGAMFGLKCGAKKGQKSDLAEAKANLDNLSEKDLNPSYKGIGEYAYPNSIPGREDFDFNELHKDLYKEYVDKECEKKSKALMDVGLVYKYAYCRWENFSLFPCNAGGGADARDDNSNKDETNQSAENCDGCKVSMCETSDDTNVDDLINSSSMGGSGMGVRPVVEIGQDMYPNASLEVYLKQHIHVDDVIGHIEGIPIKSKIDCIVDEVYPTYFIGTYYFDEGILESENPDDFANFMKQYFDDESSKFSTKDFDDLIQLYRDSYNSDIFIKDYLSFYRFPELALYTRDHAYSQMYRRYTSTNRFLYNLSSAFGYSTGYGTELSSDDFIEKYEDAANKIIDKYHNDIKKLTGKENVKKESENNQISTLKNKVDDKKKQFVKDILKLYNDNPGGMSYCSKGRIIDFMLCDNWIEYLHGDKFQYDDDNPYVVELSEAISRFIGIREKLELNASNVASLISKFNELCDSVLRPYWTGYTSRFKYINNYSSRYSYFTSYDYYSKFKELFRFKLYKNTNEIEVSDEKDKDALNLYKRIFKYLCDMTKLKVNDHDTVTVTPESDVRGMLDMFDKTSAKTSNNEELERKLRKIAHRYISLVQIETSFNNTRVGGYGSSISQWNLNEYKRIDNYIARKYDGQSYSFSWWGLDDYFGFYEEWFYYINQYTLKIYLNNLKDVTSRELYTLQKIGQKAIDWYNQNSKKIYDNEEFKKFLEIPWPTPMAVYYECCCLTKIHPDPEHIYRCTKCDYFLFTDIFGDEYLNHTGPLGNSPGIPTGKGNKPLLGNSIIPPKDINAVSKIEKMIDKDLVAQKKNPSLNTGVHVSSSGDITKLKYWLRYCGMATLINCMMPIYWATGINIMGSPVLLPIIYIPLVVIPGRVICVIGIGLCGVVPMPMILFVNPGTDKGNIIIPINIIIDVLIKQLKRISTSKLTTISTALIAPLILGLDKVIQSAENSILDIEYQLSTVKTTTIDSPKTEYLIEHKFSQMLKRDTTSKGKDLHE